MTKDELLQELKNSGVLKNPQVRKAFENIIREDFVLPEYQALAYQNHPLPIGFGQTISQPYTVAFMLDLLAPKKGEKILEIGAGSGWQTALLAYVISRERNQNEKIKNQNLGKIIAIERIPELVRMAKNNLAKYPQCQESAEVICADGSLGFKTQAPFDKIIAAASAREIPAAWKEQLKIGGRIVAPVNESIVTVDKISGDEYKTVEHQGFVFVPLIED
jgi:protein-L-isoaspartate(D-aspartate) O-methyltransferase